MMKRVGLTLEALSPAGQLMVQEFFREQVKNVKARMQLDGRMVLNVEITDLRVRMLSDSKTLVQACKVWIASNRPDVKEGVDFHVRELE